MGLPYLFHHSGKYYYIAEDIRTSRGVVRKIIRDATQEEIAAYMARKEGKNLTVVACAYPYCDNQITITRLQKRNFYVTYITRYARLELPCCSKECQEKYEAMLKP